MKKNLIYFLMCISMLVSCTDENIESVSPYSGQDVKFTASMEANNGSRTIYGAEEADGKSIKVNWVDGDKITVYGTTCFVKQADYTVNTGGAVQNFANSLDKTSGAGVQWGSNENCEFYALYPGGKFSSADGTVSVSTTINPVQKQNFKLEGTTWIGSPYVNNITNLTMENALMYAYTNYPDESSESKNGTVNFKFKPFSTVLKFKLAGWQGDGLSEETLFINKITLQAPSGIGIAGDCTLTFKDGVPTAEGGTVSSIEILPDNLPVKQGQTVEFSVFTIPVGYKMPAGDDSWIVTVETNYGLYTYNLKAESDLTMVAGQMHKINISRLNIDQEEVILPPAEWLRYIPRNVYLSELSVPGAWYATDANYQSDTNLANQYAKGIRAFHIDCRLSYNQTNSTATEGKGDLRLVATGTDKFTGTVGTTLNPGDLVLDKMKVIAEQIKPNEFVYVVLTVAEKPLSRSGIFGNYVFGNVEPSQVLSAIYTMLNDNASTLKLYNKEITPNTTVFDVLNHMIVKVNVNTTADKFTSYTNIPSALFSEGSMASNADYISGDIVAGSFTSMNTADLYWGNTKTDMTYYYHQAQLTTSDTEATSGNTTPSLFDRKKAINDIIDKSYKIYSENKHNGIFQLGIGGYTKDGSEDRAAVAKALNPYVRTLVETKLAGSPSPVGIVLMNYCTEDNDTYQSIALVKDILNMNTKFYLNRIERNKPWPDTNGVNPWDELLGVNNGENQEET